MFYKLFQLGKDTAIYGLSTILGRLLNFIIVPLYANVLLPNENGIISNLYAYIAFAFVIFCYGMEATFMRFVSSNDTKDKKQVFSITFFSLLFTSILFAIIIHLNSFAISNLISLEINYQHLIKYAGWILCFDTLSIVPFALLRMERKAKIFASLKLLNIACNLALNLVLILGFNMKTEGVLIANLSASIITFCAMLGIVFKNTIINFSFSLYKEFLKFGLPFIPAGLAGIAMQVIDRPIVKVLTNNNTLGIYQINYRLGIFMMLIVGMFDYAWRPFFLNHANDEDAKPLFSKVLTYFTVIAMKIFLTVSLFVTDLVRIKFFGVQFFPPVYWDGLAIVPYILLAYVFTGAYTIFVVGIYLEKKTKYLPFVSGAGAIINVIANFILIPYIGILGAAISTLISYVVMAIGMYFASQKYYKINYEWIKIIKITFSAIAIFMAYQLLNIEPLTTSGIIIKIVLLVCFLISLFIFKVIDKNELAVIKNLINKKFTR